MDGLLPRQRFAMRGVKEDLRGRIFGWYLVLEFAPRGPSYDKRYLCMCKCGTIKTIYALSLKSGQTKSCRCYATWFHRKRLTTHGLSRRAHVESPHEYNAWVGAKGRCFNRNNKRYKDWGGRGIVMCLGWCQSYHSFYYTLGQCPPGLTLDRIEVNGHYSCGKCSQCVSNNWPMNCRWATWKVQANNRRNNVKKNLTIAPLLLPSFQSQSDGLL